MELLSSQHYETMRPLTDEMAKELIAQIGWGNLAAISGGRIELSNGAVILPCGAGYAVMIQLDFSDTYVVRRVFRRGDKVWVKGTQTNVYFDEVGEVAYQASCYVNVNFDTHIVA